MHLPPAIILLGGTRPARARAVRVAFAAGLLLGGCGTRAREEMPPVQTAAVPAPPAPQPEPPRPPREPSMREEPIDTSPPPPPEPVPSATLERGAPPQVAAATRLAEEGHRRMKSGEGDAGLDLLERAVALDPNNAFAYQYLAEAYLDLGRYDQALAFADRAAALGATVSPLWRSRSYALQGRILERAGDFEHARRAYRRALATDADNADALAGLVRLGSGAP